MSTPLSQIPNLSEFLATLSVKEPSDRRKFFNDVISFTSPISGIDKFGNSIESMSPEIKIWYEEVNGFGLDDLIKIVSNQLKSSGHITDRHIILGVIGLYTLLRSDNQPDSLLHLLRSTTKTPASIFFVMPKTHPVALTRIVPFKFGSYSFGVLEMKKLKRLCKSAGSDYYERYEKSLRGRFSFHREFPDITCVNWFPFRKSNAIRLQLLSDKNKAFNELVEFYFGYLHGNLIDRFFDEMFEQMQLLIALEKTYIDEQTLRLLPMTESIAIFQNVDGRGENGFVSSRSTKGLAIDFGGYDKRIPRTLDLLTSQYNISVFSELPIHKLIGNYVSFMAKAIRHQFRNAEDDAFLHFIIALDLVFGEAEKSTETIASRVAALTHHKSGVTYEDQVKVIKALYKKRSKFVHEGMKVGANDLDQVERICTEVLYCMLRIQKDEERRAHLDSNTWLRHLDLIVALQKASRPISIDLLIECGIEEPRNDE